MSQLYPPQKISEFVDFKNGKSIKPGGNGQYRVFGSNGIIGGTSEYREENGIIIGRVGAYCGSVKYCSGKFWASDNTIVAHPKTESADIIYFYYLLHHLNLNCWAGGAAQPLLTQTSLKQVEGPIPDIKIQQKIAGILSAYDDLIENNLKRIKLLEEIAQTTYEEWFVRLRFPGHETTPINSETGLPKGWKSKNIGSLIEREIGGGWGLEKMDAEHSAPAYVIRGTDIYGLNNSNVKNIPFRFHKKSNLRSRKLNHGDIVFEVSGGSRTEGVAKTGFITTALLNQFGKNVMCASFCKLLHPIDCSIGLILFHYFRFLRKIKATEIFEIHGASSIINYNWKAFLKFQKIPFPSSKLIEKFYHNAIVIHDEVQNLSSQNQRLREARDILLPRLITGMIDVEEYNPADLLKEAI